MRGCALLAALVLGCAGVVLRSESAAACSCRGITTATALRQADTAFLGTVTALDAVDRPKPGRTDIRFEVTRVYKGTAYRSQLVASDRDGAGCGLSPQVGSTWVIFAVLGVEGEGDDTLTRLRSGLCSGNIPGASAPPVLGPGRAPLAGASDREESALRTDAAIDRWLGVAGIGVMGLVGLAGTGLALAWRRSGNG